MLAFMHTACYGIAALDTIFEDQLRPFGACGRLSHRSLELFEGLAETVSHGLFLNPSTIAVASLSLVPLSRFFLEARPRRRAISERFRARRSSGDRPSFVGHVGGKL
jgi:hypothetical protein